MKLKKKENYLAEKFPKKKWARKMGIGNGWKSIALKQFFSCPNYFNGLTSLEQMNHFANQQQTKIANTRAHTPPSFTKLAHQSGHHIVNVSIE